MAHCTWLANCTRSKVVASLYSLSLQLWSSKKDPWKDFKKCPLPCMQPENCLPHLVPLLSCFMIAERSSLHIRNLLHTYSKDNSLTMESQGMYYKCLKHFIGNIQRDSNLLSQHGMRSSWGVAQAKVRLNLLLSHHASLPRIWMRNAKIQQLWIKKWSKVFTLNLISLYHKPLDTYYNLIGFITIYIFCFYDGM